MSAKVLHSRSDWKWFGNAAHLIVGHDCRFHLATLVGPWMVSTVGQWWPSRLSREIHARIHDAKWHAANNHLLGDNYDAAYMKRFGYEEVGCDRTFETMVFKVSGKTCSSKECGCGLPEIVPSELDFEGYNDAGAATQGHYAMCEKWSRVAKEQNR